MEDEKMNTKITSIGEMHKSKRFFYFAILTYDFQNTIQNLL